MGQEAPALAVSNGEITQKQGYSCALCKKTSPGAVISRNTALEADRPCEVVLRRLEVFTGFDRGRAE